MIRHIVMWKMRPDAAPDCAGELKRRLESLVGVVPELLSCEVGLNAGGDRNAYDLVLTADFADLDALERYRVNPDHRKVAEFVRGVSAARAAVDYVLPEERSE